MEEVFDYEEALRKAKNEAARTGLYYVVVPAFEEYYTVMSYNEWLFSSLGDYVVRVDARGEELE
jgi:hypothetical protein